ncbi:MAG: tRNA lysidine(34) synthetase TilS [Thermomonas sp.]
MRALPDLVMRNDGRPLLVAYSGGLDSTVLLHTLVAGNLGRVRVLHVHHGLHADADSWAAHCQRTCDALGVELLIERVVVGDTGLGREGAARAVRHAAFARELREGEVLALAHHRDDQAETFFLRALRGSGVDGLAAMRPWRAYARGWLWRPLLDTPREALLEYARGHGLSWIEDPSNEDASLDRNFLRNQVLPLLRARWPQAGAAFARSAGLGAEAAALLSDGDDVALTALRNSDGALAIDALQPLPVARRARVLRRWIAQRGLPPLPGNGVACIESDLLGASADAQACFDWAGMRIQRWRGHLHARALPLPLPADWSQDWDGCETLCLPNGATLALVGAESFESRLRAHARQGGERIVLPGRTHHHALKHVLQDMVVPPWQRVCMPLLSDAGGELQAAGDSILSATLDAWLRAQGARLDWRDAVIA